MASKTELLLVCGGKYHDFEYVRARLGEWCGDNDVRLMLRADYADVAAIENARALVTYTTDVIPADDEQDALDAFLATGGRWFALHGTNSVIDIDERGYASSPRVAPRFMEMLGSQFIAHPPKGEFQVYNAQPTDPLVQGIDTFTVDDELYLVEQRGDIDVLLYTHYNGRAMRGFTERDFFSDERRPIMYRRRWHSGEVLYLNLGHCRGHDDMKPLMDHYPHIERCSWSSPVFAELMDRGLRWTLEGAPP